MSSSKPSEPASRNALRYARRVVVKAGTSVLTNENGSVSLTRMGAIAEQISELVKDGVEVIYVSSGATGMGKKLLRKQGRMNLSLNELHVHDENRRGRGASFDNPMDSHLARRGSGLKASESFANLLDTSYHKEEKKKHYDCACAAAGQFELMNLYSSMFSQCDVTPSQILVTQRNFQDPENLKTLTYTIDRLLSLGIVPIVNENDAVSGNTGYGPANVFSDNDSLAALCARSFGAEVLVILTDVPGVYDKPPSEKGSKMIKFFEQSDGDDIEIGAKSTHGRGGMGAKIQAAINAVKPGTKCNACVVVGGNDLNAIRALLGRNTGSEFGEPKGTLFLTPGSKLHEIACEEVEAAKVRMYMRVI